MTDCTEMRLLLQADIDGELDAGSAARVATHLADCAECTAARQAILDLKERMRTDLTYHTAPDALRARLVAAMAEAAPVRPMPVIRPRRGGRALVFGIGTALAAGLAVVMVMPRGGDLADAVVASHIRALQPGHLMDVISTDQHTVKPWFDGRLDFAPPVRDLVAQGFPLAGGRLDYLDGRPVAALAYNRLKHVIDLYVWPSAAPLPAGSGAVNGYNWLRWNKDGMEFWAVSDLNPKELGEFAEDLQASR